MMPAVTAPLRGNIPPKANKPAPQQKQKYLDVFIPEPCEFLRTPEQQQLSVLNLVQNGGALYVLLPENYFHPPKKPTNPKANYWKAIINSLLSTPSKVMKQYTGWKQQRQFLASLKGVQA